MSEKQLRCVYGEMVKDKRLSVVIEEVRTAPKPLYCQGEKTAAWDIIFAQKDKAGANLYVQIPKLDENGKATGLLRGYIAECGGEPDAAHIGKPLTLIAKESKKSETGWAVRIGKTKQ